eukprot:jgi/Tetstr1/438580/TSEL_027131.t1
MGEESRSRIVTNLIRTLSRKIGVQILPADVRVVTRRPPKPAAADTAEPIGTRLPTPTGSVILRLARRDTAESVLQTQWTTEGTAILDRQGRRCSSRLLGAPHLDDIERPVHQVWLRSPSFRGLTKADMWLRLAEGLLPANDQPLPCEAAADQPAATPADTLALAGDVCRDVVLALPFGDQSQGRAVIQVTVEHNEDREDQPTTPFPRVLPPALSKQFFRCAVTAKAICTGPLANLELPTVEQLAEAIATTISQRTNTPPELHHAQWLTDTMTAAGIEMHRYHTEPTLLCVGDNNLCAISLGKEDEEFADTLPAPDDEEELDLNYEEMDSAMEVDTTHELASHAAETHQLLNPRRLSILLERHPSQPTPASKGKTATTVKLKKKQTRGRSRSAGATRNRSRSKPRLSRTRGSDSEWETDDDADQPSSSSH